MRKLKLQNKRWIYEMKVSVVVSSYVNKMDKWIIKTAIQRRKSIFFKHQLEENA